MRICKYKDCNFPVFGTDKNTGKGYCQSHQWCRTDRKSKKPSSSNKNSKPIECSFGYEDQFTLFMSLWQSAKDKNGDIICPFTNMRLNHLRYRNIFWNCFMHILPKKNYPYFKLNPNNVRVVYPEFHRIHDQGSSKDREKHPKWKWEEVDSLKEELKQEYQEFKKQNFLP